MALQPADLLTPSGALEAAVHWPGESEEAVDSRLAVYLQQGYLQGAAITLTADLDRYARRWSYYRARDELYQRLIARPASAADSDEGSFARLMAQIDAVKAERDADLAALDEILEEYEDEVDDEFGVIQSYR